ncbi:MAG TPA: MBL fold metallo-hydrolase [Devosia sp.]|nr:MBL fold metallo-hydrolase [Devosia sp.]
MPAAPPPPLSFDTTFDPQTSTPVTVAPGVVRITAPNAGPYTFTGTNTFILGTDRVAVVDPGPFSESHAFGILNHIGDRPVEAIILTHTHRDHSDLAKDMVAATRAPLWFAGRHQPSRKRRLFEMDWVRGESDYDLVPHRELADGERIAVAGFELEVIATPGHCANHLCFGLAGTGTMLSGDHVMGWSTSMIAVPDGSMAAYFDSLKKVAALPYRQYLPAHGGPIADGPQFARQLLAHREMRNEQIVTAVKDGARNTGQLLAAIYPKLDVKLLPAARMTLSAHIEYLSDNNRIRSRRGLFGTVVGPV